MNTQSTEGLTSQERSTDAFLSAVFHELRTPLTVMYTYAQLALDKLPSETQFNNLRLLLERMIQQGDETIEMLEELLEATRIASNRIVLDKADVKIVGLLQQVISERWPDSMVEVGPVQLVIAPDTSEVTTQIDGPRLKQAFETLLNFLFEANQVINDTRAGAIVKIEISQLDSYVYLNFTTSKLELTLAQEAMLFDFYRPVQVLAGGGGALQPKGSRMGVGLFTAQGMLRLQGGDLTYDAALPGFKIKLPLHT